MTSARTAAGLCAAAAIAALALTGCTAPAQHPSTSTPSATAKVNVKGLPTGVQQATSVPTNVPNAPSKRSAVTITDCVAADKGWQAKGKADNQGKQPETYTITIFFTTDKGTVIGTGDTKVTVDPGKTGSWTVNGALTPAPKTLCVLRGVG